MFTPTMLKLAAATVLLGVVHAQNSSLPTVDLGYELYQASGFNATYQFYNFSNIRYAAPPVGNLRFAAPQDPAENRSVVQTGDIGRICPPANPAWSAVADLYLEEFILGTANNDTTPFIPPTVNSSTPLPPQAQTLSDPRVSEDCLFLDVFVPEQIFNAAGNGDGAPVLVWIYGGGYVTGDKYENPAGLLAASGNVSDGEVIYVAMNYRLGALGWSSGPSFQAEGGVSNVGLLDQRFALDWVQKNIHLFGGDAERVTVFGESAGGGSIMHHITAYGGLEGPAPFQQAIPQSPGWLPVSSQSQQEDIYQQLLDLTETSSLAELRALSSEEIISKNWLQVWQSPYGAYTYGPVVDGLYVPLQPGQLLAQGRFDKNLSVMVGHNSDEGLYFTPGSINSTAALVAQVRGTFPNIPNASLEYITQTLYPEVFDGSYPYTDEIERARLIVGEAIFTCNTYYLSTAFDNKTYSYLFAVPPGFHGEDVMYTYYDGGAINASNPLTQVTNRTVAIALQDFITSFAKDGKPEAEGIRPFDMYGANATVLDLNVTGISEVRDSNANNRCNWWQKALYS